MKETTKNYLKSIVNDFNRFADKEAFDEMLNQSYMLVSALTILELEGIAKFKIVHDVPFKLYSTIHLEAENKKEGENV